MFHVILHNDDVTTMEFVVHLLTTVFRKSEPAAQEIMLTVHHKGSATVGPTPTMWRTHAKPKPH